MATHCNTLQHTARHRKVRATRLLRHSVSHTATHCQTLQHTATHCNALQDKGDETASPRCISLTHRNTLQHTATHCNTLHHGATHIKTHALRLKYQFTSMTVSTENATHPKSSKSRNSNSSVRIQIGSNISIWIVPRNTEKSKFLDLLDFGDIAFAVETVISRDTRTRQKLLWISRFGGFGGCCTFSGNCYIKRHTHSSEILWISCFGWFGRCCTFSGNCYVKTHAHRVKYYFRSLHHTATYYNTLKHTATNCTLLQQTAIWVLHVQAELYL